MRKLLTFKTLHFISLIAIICVFFVGKLAYIQNDTPYVRLINNEIEIGQCYYVKNFGIECPSCGLTRSFVSIEDFNIKQAFYYNRIGTFIFMLFILIGIYNLLSILNFRYANKFGVAVGIYGVISCIALVINWIYKIFFEVL